MYGEKKVLPEEEEEETARWADDDIGYVIILDLFLSSPPIANSRQV